MYMASAKPSAKPMTARQRSTERQDGIDNRNCLKMNEIAPLCIYSRIAPTLKDGGFSVNVVACLGKKFTITLPSADFPLSLRARRAWQSPGAAVRIRRKASIDITPHSGDCHGRSALAMTWSGDSWERKCKVLCVTRYYIEKR